MNLLRSTNNPPKSINFSGFFGESMTSSSLAFIILRNNKQSYTQILNPELSLVFLYKAIMFLKVLNEYQKEPLSVLFLNTNPNYNGLIKLAAKDQHLVYSKWVGGTLTNWQQVSKSIRAFQAFQWKWESLLVQKSLLFPQLEKMQKRYKEFYNPLKKNLKVKNWTHYQFQFFDLLFGMSQKKPEKLPFRTILKSIKSRKIDRLHQPKKMPKQLKKPQVLIVLDTYANKSAVEEAWKRNIPVIAFINSDSDAKGIQYPIPGNNQNFFFVHFCLNFIVMILQK